MVKAYLPALKTSPLAGWGWGHRVAQGVTPVLSALTDDNPLVKDNNRVLNLYKEQQVM